MLGYFNVDPRRDYGGRRQYSHSTMFVGKIKANDAGRITCHTKSRFGGLSSFPDEWHLADPAYKYTFIHIGRDDPASMMSARGLHGWWRISDVGNQFYHLTLDGRVSFTMNARRSPLDSPAVALSTGHYFAVGGKVTGHRADEQALLREGSAVVKEQAQAIPHEEFALLCELLVVLRRAAFARPDARLGDRAALTRHGRKCSPVGGRVRVLPALGELARE